MLEGSLYLEEGGGEGLLTGCIVFFLLLLLMGGAYKWGGAYNRKFTVQQTNPYITNNYIEGLYVISSNKKHKKQGVVKFFKPTFWCLDIGPVGIWCMYWVCDIAF